MRVLYLNKRVRRIGYVPFGRHRSLQNSAHNPMELPTMDMCHRNTILWHKTATKLRQTQWKLNDNLWIECGKHFREVLLIPECEKMCVRVECDNDSLSVSAEQTQHKPTETNARRMMTRWKCYFIIAGHRTLHWNIYIGQKLAALSRKIKYYFKFRPECKAEISSGLSARLTLKRVRHRVHRVQQ